MWEWMPFAALIIMFYYKVKSNHYMISTQFIQQWLNETNGGEFVGNKTNLWEIYNEIL